MITPQKMFKGFFYTLGTGYAARLCSVGLTVLIKRQLEPSVFADVFLGVTVFTMLSSLREFGLTHALLHFPRSSRGIRRYALCAECVHYPAVVFVDQRGRLGLDIAFPRGFFLDLCPSRVGTGGAALCAPTEPDFRGPA